MFAASALLAVCAANTGCGDDDEFSAVDNQKPTIALEADEIHWEFARKFVVKAKVDDADGIKAINLQNKDLYLNKTIDILRIYGDTVKTYNLEYGITAPDSLKTEAFPILITVEDLVGNVSAVTFNANMDGDFTDPKFTQEPGEVINVIMSAFNFKFAVSDNRVIQRVTVSFPDLNINEDITNDSKTYEYKKTISLGDENRDYKGVIAAYDAYNNKVEKAITISKGELKDYDRMYLCDVETEADLIADVCGVPMLIDHSGEFEYTALYYNATAGTKVRFMPQKNSFEPICFGTDPSNSAMFTPDPAQAQPIVLDQAGVYYKIVFNTKQGTYTTSTYTVDDAADPIPHKLGSQSLNTWCSGVWNKETGEWETSDAWWQDFNVGIMTDNPRNVTDFFDYNPQNKHIIQILNYHLEKGNFEFHPHNWHHDGWWDYCTWKPEAATETEPDIWRYVGQYANPAYEAQANKYNNEVEVGNHAKLSIPKSGNYDIIFDTHLGRMKIVPSK